MEPEKRVLEPDFRHFLYFDHDSRKLAILEKFSKYKLIFCIWFEIVFRLQDRLQEARTHVHI